MNTVYKNKFVTHLRRQGLWYGGVDDQCDADLTDVSSISKENNDVKYIIFVIDDFSKYLWVEYLENKTTKEVVTGFKTIFEKCRKCK